MSSLLSVRDVHFTYDESTEVLAGVSLEIGTGECIALIGPNGSGKTTLAKHLNGLLKPTSGDVSVDGRSTTDIVPGELAGKVGYVFQNPDHQIFSPTVEEELAYGPTNLGLGEAERSHRVERALELFDLKDHRLSHPTMLGRSLRRRVAIASVYSLEPQVLVLDEPTGGFDRRTTVDLMNVTLRLAAQGRTVLIITHDMRLVGEYAQRVVVMSEGQIRGDGPTSQILPDRALLESAGLKPPEVTLLSHELADLGVQPAINLTGLCEDLALRITSTDSTGTRTGKQ